MNTITPNPMPQADDHDPMTYDRAYKYLEEAEELFLNKFGNGSTPDQVIRLAEFLLQIDANRPFIPA